MGFSIGIRVCFVSLIRGAEMSMGVVESPWQKRRAYSILHNRIQRLRFGTKPDQRWTQRMLERNLDLNTVIDLYRLVRLRDYGPVPKSTTPHVDHDASSGISSNPL